MSTRVNDDGTANDRATTGQLDAALTIESYETEEGVVFYDAENPLAWVETSRTLCLKEQA